MASQMSTTQKIQFCLDLIRDNFKHDKVKEYETIIAIGQAIKNELKDGGLITYVDWCNEYTTEKHAIQMYQESYKYENKNTSDRQDINTIIGIAKEFDVEGVLKTDQEKAQEEYEEMREVFELTHFKCNDSFYHIYNNSLNQYTRAGILTKYEHLKLSDDTYFIQLWLKDSEMRIYDKIDFLPPPTHDDDNIFNTWSLIPTTVHEPIDDRVDISVFDEFFGYLCLKDEKVVDYLKYFLAHLLQYPATKPEVGWFFTGAQGGGKDTFAYLLKKLIDKSTVSIDSDPDNIFGKYNLNTRLNKLVVILQEADNIKQFSGKIKDVITCKTVRLADKGIKGIEVQDYTRLMIFSNNENIINVEPTDRRFMTVKTWNFHIDKNPEFFTRLYSAIENPKFINKLRNELMNMEVNEYYNFQQNRPETELYRDLKEVNTPSIIRWAWCLSKLDNTKDLTGAELCTHYNEWCKQSWESHTDTNVKSFGLNLKKYFYINNNWNGFEKKRSNGTKYAVNKEELQSFVETKYGYGGEE